MMKTILIDDEPNNLLNLQRLLEKHCPQLHITGTAGDADAGQSLIQATQPDLVFLDIQMPGKSGFELLQELPTSNFEVIFVTAFDQYAIQAIRFSAIDYLLKPVSVEQLKMAVARAKERHTQRSRNHHLENLVALLQQAPLLSEHRIALPSTKETRFVAVKDIIRCESSNSYTSFHLVNEESILVSVSLAEYEELLEPYGFIRCHQSHLVNKRFVKSLVKQDGGYLLLDNQVSIPVSRSRRELVKKALQ